MRNDPTAHAASLRNNDPLSSSISESPELKERRSAQISAALDEVSASIERSYPSLAPYIAASVLILGFREKGEGPSLRPSLSREAILSNISGVIPNIVEMADALREELKEMQRLGLLNRMGEGTYTLPSSPGNLGPLLNEIDSRIFAQPVEAKTATPQGNPEKVDKRRVRLDRDIAETVDAIEGLAKQIDASHTNTLIDLIGLVTILSENFTIEDCIEQILENHPNVNSSTLTHPRVVTLKEEFEKFEQVERPRIAEQLERKARAAVQKGITRYLQYQTNDYPITHYYPPTPSEISAELMRQCQVKFIEPRIEKLISPYTKQFGLLRRFHQTLSKAVDFEIATDEEKNIMLPLAEILATLDVLKSYHETAKKHSTMHIMLRCSECCFDALSRYETGKILGIFGPIRDLIPKKSS